SDAFSSRTDSRSACVPESERVAEVDIAPYCSKGGGASSAHSIIDTILYLNGQTGFAVRDLHGRPAFSQSRDGYGRRDRTAGLPGRLPGSADLLRAAGVQ